MKFKAFECPEPDGFGLCSVGAAILGAGALSAGASIFGAQSAADAQRDAANNAIAAQQAQYNQMRNDLSPYMTAGNNALTDVQSRLPFLTSPIVMNQANLEQTPGYQFNLSQGLRAAQNALTQTGLGRSGAAVKAATRFGTGLADSTYQNQFNNENTNRANTFNRLMALVRSGQNAAAGVGNQGIVTGQGVANSLIGAGNAQGAANVATGNAIGNAGNALTSYALYNATQNQQSPVGAQGMYGWNNPDYGGGGVAPGQWYMG